MTSLQVDLDIFLSRHLEALEKDQARHNLIFGLLEKARINPNSVLLWSLGDGASCAVQSPPHFIVLGDLSLYQCEALARDIAGVDYLGCIGSNKVPAIFAESLAFVKEKGGMTQGWTGSFDKLEEYLGLI